MGAIKVELVEVGLDFLAVGYERGELSRIEAAPLVIAEGALQGREQGHRALMHEVHCPGVNGDMSRTERSDGCGGSIETDKMHIDIAVVLEGSGDRQTGGEGPAEAVNKDVDLLALVLCEFAVNGRAIEVVASDVAFE